jgi:hypothetical protein
MSDPAHVPTAHAAAILALTAGSAVPAQILARIQEGLSERS